MSLRPSICSNDGNSNQATAGGGGGARGKSTPGEESDIVVTAPQNEQPKVCPKGKVLTIGVSVNLAIVFGVSAEGGVAINLSSGRPSLYGAVGKTYGVDISAGIGPGLYKDISALQGSYTEIAAGLLAGSLSGLFNDKKEFVGSSLSVGPGLPASGRATQGVGGTLGGGC